METTLAILVLVIVIVAFVGVGWLYVRSTGGSAWRAWLVAPASLRHTVGSLMGGAGASAPDRTAETAAGANDTTPIRDGQRGSGSVTLAYDDTALATLENDLRGDLDDARERQGETESRLQRIEATMGDIRTIPDDLGNMMRLQDRRTRRQLEQLRNELEGVRRSATAAGARRDEAYVELYGHLARIEGAMGSAFDPMFLPGEPLTLPDELSPVTLDVENWDEVGEHALAFGKAFNQNRLVLDQDTATEIESFLAILRQAMMTAVYPTVRRGAPNRAQLTHMRNGLESIIEALTPVRRRLEATYHGTHSGASEPDGGEYDLEDEE
jgi:hypothetical protein